MIDPILLLAFSMHSNKGVYALLLGSGISRAAGIPTGWEVTCDLIRKLAHMKGQACEPDPAKWYADTFSEEANYSKLLRVVAKTSWERNKLLRGYFEPTEEERQQHIKTPTVAHRAIADLVTQGYIKVILTTNFDRLMEKALEEVGVIPTVISTRDAIEGATPITHATCTVIKLHGDYLDSRIKNTPEELAIYGRQLNALLDRILDEFGLIICGWSGEWDTALRDAMQRCKSRRYTTFWTVKDSLVDKARTLAELRQAEIIRIQSADAFFGELAEKIVSISEFERPHPLSAQVAVVTLKRYLEDDKYKIRLHDLVMQEVEKIHNSLSAENFPDRDTPFSPQEGMRRIKFYDSLTEIVQAISAVSGYWGNSTLAACFTKALERLSDRMEGVVAKPDGFDLRLYPALLVLYSSGLAALAAKNYEMLASVLLRPQDRSIPTKPKPLILSLSPVQAVQPNVGRQLPDPESELPLSEYVLRILAKPLREFLPGRREYEETFDRFEFFCALVVADLDPGYARYWLPIMRFGSRYEEGAIPVLKKIRTEIERDGEDWLPLKSGFFGGSLSRAYKAVSSTLTYLDHPSNHLTEAR